MALIFDIGFQIDDKNLSSQVKGISNSITNAFNSIGTANGPRQFTIEMQKASESAKILESTLKRATMENGQISFATMNAGLRKAGLTASQLTTNLALGGSQFRDALNQANIALATSNRQAITLNAKIHDMAKTFMNSFKYSAANRIFVTLVSATQQAVQWTKELEKSVNYIGVVTGKTGDALEKVTQNAIKSAKQLKVAAKDYADAAFIFYQQGLNDSEVQKRSEITIKAAKAAGQSVETMSQQLTAVWNTYQMTGEEQGRAASVGAKLAATTASEFKDITEAMQLSAIAASQMGVSYDSLAAIIATVRDTTQQSASVIGNAFKTIFSRFEQLKAEGTDGEVTLNTVSANLEKLGVHVLDSAGNLRNLQEVITEVGNSWGQYSQKQQLAIAEQVGGVRQYSQFLALMQNWDKYQRNLQTAQNETGTATLEQQYKTQRESIESLAEQSAEAWKRAFGKIIDEDVIKDFYDFSKKLGDLLGNIFDGIGGLPGLLTLIGLKLSQNIATPVANVATDIVNWGKNLKATKDQMGTWGMVKDYFNGNTNLIYGRNKINQEYDQRLAEIDIKKAAITSQYNEKSNTAISQYEKQQLEQEYNLQIMNLNTLRQKTEFLREIDLKNNEINLKLKTATGEEKVQLETARERLKLTAERFQSNADYSAEQLLGINRDEIEAQSLNQANELAHANRAANETAQQRFLAEHRITDAYAQQTEALVERDSIYERQKANAQQIIAFEQQKEKLFQEENAIQEKINGVQEKYTKRQDETIAKQDAAIARLGDKGIGLKGRVKGMSVDQLTGAIAGIDGQDKRTKDDIAYRTVYKQELQLRDMQNKMAIDPQIAKLQQDLTLKQQQSADYIAQKNTEIAKEEIEIGQIRDANNAKLEKTQGAIDGITKASEKQRKSEENANVININNMTGFNLAARIGSVAKAGGMEQLEPLTQELKDHAKAVGFTGTEYNRLSGQMDSAVAKYNKAEQAFADGEITERELTNTRINATNALANFSNGIANAAVENGKMTQSMGETVVEMNATTTSTTNLSKEAQQLKEVLREVFKEAGFIKDSTAGARNSMEQFGLAVQNGTQLLMSLSMAMTSGMNLFTVWGDNTKDTTDKLQSFTTSLLMFLPMVPRLLKGLESVVTGLTSQGIASQITAKMVGASQEQIDAAIAQTNKSAAASVNWFTLLITIAAVAIKIYSGIKQAQKERRQAAIDAAEKEIEENKKLIDSFKDLNSTIEKNLEITKDLTKSAEEIAKAYGDINVQLARMSINLNKAGIDQERLNKAMELARAGDMTAIYELEEEAKNRQEMENYRKNRELIKESLPDIDIGSAATYSGENSKVYRELTKNNKILKENGGITLSFNSNRTKFTSLVEARTYYQELQTLLAKAQELGDDKLAEQLQKKLDVFGDHIEKFNEIATSNLELFAKQNSQFIEKLNISSASIRDIAQLYSSTMIGLEAQGLDSQERQAYWNSVLSGNPELKRKYQVMNLADNFYKKYYIPSEDAQLTFQLSTDALDLWAQRQERNTAKRKDAVATHYGSWDEIKNTKNYEAEYDFAAGKVNIKQGDSIIDTIQIDMDNVKQRSAEQDSIMDFFNNNADNENILYLKPELTDGSVEDLEDQLAALDELEIEVTPKLKTDELLKQEIESDINFRDTFKDAAKEMNKQGYLSPETAEKLFQAGYSRYLTTIPGAQEGKNIALNKMAENEYNTRTGNITKNMMDSITGNAGIDIGVSELVASVAVASSVLDGLSDPIDELTTKANKFTENNNLDNAIEFIGDMDMKVSSLVKDEKGIKAVLSILDAMDNTVEKAQEANRNAYLNGSIGLDKYLENLVSNGNRELENLRQRRDALKQEQDIYVQNKKEQPNYNMETDEEYQSRQKQIRNISKQIGTLEDDLIQAKYVGSFWTEFANSAKSFKWEDYLESDFSLKVDINKDELVEQVNSVLSKLGDGVKDFLIKSVLGDDVTKITTENVGDFLKGITTKTGELTEQIGKDVTGIVQSIEKYTSDFKLKVKVTAEGQMIWKTKTGESIFSDLWKTGESTVNAVTKGFNFNFDTSGTTFSETGAAAIGDAAGKLASDISTLVTLENALGRSNEVGNGTYNTGKESGSGGNKATKKDQHTKDEQLQRYVDLENAIEAVSNAIEKMNKAEEDSYGRVKLSNMAKKNAALLKEAQLMERQYKDAQKYLAADQQDITDFVLNKFGETATFTEDGKMANREYIMNKYIIPEINRLQAEATAATNLSNKNPDDDDLKEKATAATDALNDYKEDVKETLENMISRADEAAEKVRDLLNEQIDHLKQYFDNIADILSQEIELKIDISDTYVKSLERAIKYFGATTDQIGVVLNKYQSIRDEQQYQISTRTQGLYDGLDMLRILAGEPTVEGIRQMISSKYGYKYGDLTSLMFTEDNQLTDAFAQYREGNQGIPAAMMKFLNENLEGLQDIEDEYISTIESVIDLYKDSVDMWFKEFDDITERMDYYNSKLDVIQSALNFTKVEAGPEGRYYRRSLIAAEWNQTLAKQQVLGQKQKLANDAYWDAQLQEKQYLKSIGNIEQSAMNEAQVAAFNKYHQVVEDTKKEFYDATKEFDEATKEVFEKAAQFASEEVEIYSEELMQALTTSGQRVTQMGGLSDVYEYLQELQNRYLDEYEKNYELTKLDRSIAKELEDINDPSRLAEWAKFQDKLNEKRAEGVRLTERDVEILNAEFELQKLYDEYENAKSAKNSMRLQRDASGNWSYVYSNTSGDAEEIAQKIDDQLYKIRQLHEQTADEMSDLWLQNREEWMQYIHDIDWALYNENELYREEVTRALAEFEDKNAFYSEQVELHNDAIGRSFEETALGIITDYGSIEAANAAYNTHFDIYTQNLIDNNKKYQESTQVAKDAITWDWRYIDETIEEVVKEVEQESNNFVQAAQDLQEKAGKALYQLSWDTRTYVKDMVSSYSDLIEAAKQAQRQITALRSVSNIDQANDILNGNYELTTDYSEKMYNILQRNGIQMDPTEVKKIIKDDDNLRGIAYEAMNAAAARGYYNGDDFYGFLNWWVPNITEISKHKDRVHDEIYNKYDPIVARVNYAIGEGYRDFNEIFGYVQKSLEGSGFTDQEIYDILTKLFLNNGLPMISSSSSNKSGLASGGLVKGFTISSLGEEGPELILNRTDTENILAAVGAMRDIALAQTGSLGGSISGAQVFGNNTVPVAQDVKIEASFPNVSVASEIEEALNNLVNEAVQYTTRK